MSPVREQKRKTTPTDMECTDQVDGTELTSTAAQESDKAKDKGADLLGNEEEMPVTGDCPVWQIDPSAKIKLQLFPADEATRMALQKCGHHPYLELTLKARKKISSVLKHIKNKWGNSSIATGEPILFPYYIRDKASRYAKWGMDNKGVSAGDVYAAIGCPAIFRLRYGWSSNSRGKPFKRPSKLASMEHIPLSTISAEACQQPRDNRLRQEDKPEMKSLHDEENMKMSYKHLKLTSLNKETLSAKDEMLFPDQPMKSMENVDAAAGFYGQQSSLWADGLTNISIGGLLSEASLQGKFDQADPKMIASNPTLLPSQIISDSWDALFSGRVNHTLGESLRPNEQHSSIFDAEDTCHAFAFQRPSSDGGTAVPCGGSGLGISSHDASLSFGKPSKMPEDDKQVKTRKQVLQNLDCEGSATNLSLCLRVYSDESSLGLAGIKWTDSLGPFDLGLPSRKIINGNSITQSGFVR